MTLEEMNKKAKEQLSKQLPVTFEEAKAQAQRLKIQSENREFKDNSLESLLADFTEQNTKKDTTVKQEVNEPISLKERAIRCMELIAKQEPVTLNQARSQVLRLIMQSGKGNKGHKGVKIIRSAEEEVRHHLQMYFPKLSKKKIEEGVIKLYRIHGNKIH